MPDDNSCLFRAVGFLLDKQPYTPTLYREIIATTISGTKQLYTEAILGKSNAEYTTWIQKPTAWGGAIELSIFSQIYQTELVAFDIIHMNKYTFGEGKGYDKRAYLMYSGIHYDAFAGISANTIGTDEPNELDQTIFSPDDSAIFAKVYQIAQAMHDANQYTDTARYSLKCSKCGSKLIGNSGAQKHAELTGHVDFEEYN